MKTRRRFGLFLAIVLTTNLIGNLSLGDDAAARGARPTPLLDAVPAIIGAILGNKPGGGSHVGMSCFAHLEAAASDLRSAITSLNRIASVIEPRGQTVIATNGASRQAGAYQYQLYRTCDIDVVLRGRDQIRDSLDFVRQAFRSSLVLSKQPQAFNAFKRMVTAWETLRDMVSDATIAMECPNHVLDNLDYLKVSVDAVARTAARYEFRGQTQFTADIASREIDNILRRLALGCPDGVLLPIRDTIRDRLDGVRTAFRASATLSRVPEAFEAFRRMVTDWEVFRDSVSDVPH